MAEERDPKTHAIIGAAMEVHRELGCGFLEAIYQEAMAIELALRSVPFAREEPLRVEYKGKPLATAYRADFVCFESVLVELKALQKLSTGDEAQVLNYLKATGHQIGLLLNFGSQSLEFKRLIRSAHWSARACPQIAPMDADCDKKQTRLGTTLEHE